MSIAGNHMSKRSNSTLFAEELRDCKRMREEDIGEKQSPPEATPGHPALQIMNVIGDEVPQKVSPLERDTRLANTEGKPKKDTKRKAGEGFRPWKPKPACAEIPQIQPHWGIIPRPGGYQRPSEAQPPARSSEGAVRPALWEDRKGAVRLKRGSRYINGYDQAYHMWLPLMDVRPISSKNQRPRRVAVSYYYSHGMPVDWNDTGVLNDLNKALQEAIKAKSNKEAPFDQTERNILAQIFAEIPEISMLDAAEQFNLRAYPLSAPEEGRYPSGRFTESIQHEFSIYKSSYIKGEAPTAMTERDIPLEKIYADWKAKHSKAQAAKKKAAVQKLPKNRCSGKMSDPAGMTKKSSSRKPQVTTGELGARQSRADFEYVEIMDMETSREVVNTASQKRLAQLSDGYVSVAEQTRLYDVEGEMLELGGAYAPEDEHSLSPVSVSSRAVVDSPSYGVVEFNTVDWRKETAHKKRIDSNIAPGEVVGNVSVVTVNSQVKSTLGREGDAKH